MLTALRSVFTREYPVKFATHPPQHTDAIVCFINSLGKQDEVEREIQTSILLFGSVTSKGIPYFPIGNAVVVLGTRLLIAPIISFPNQKPTKEQVTQAFKAVTMLFFRSNGIHIIACPGSIKGLPLQITASAIKTGYDMALEEEESNSDSWPFIYRGR